MGDIYPSEYGKKLSQELKVFFPILDWTTSDVFEYLENKDVKINPLYNEGVNDRVGCYPCMLASKKIQEAAFQTEFGKKQLSKIREIEQELGISYEMFDTSDQGSCNTCNT